MELVFNRSERKFVTITVSATLANGHPATVTSALVGLTTPGRSPDQSTVWVPFTISSNSSDVLFAGPDVDAQGGISVPLDGGDVWVQVIDSVEIVQTLAGRIDIRKS